MGWSERARELKARLRGQSGRQARQDDSSGGIIPSLANNKWLVHVDWSDLKIVRQISHPTEAFFGDVFLAILDGAQVYVKLLPGYLSEEGSTGETGEAKSHLHSLLHREVELMTSVQSPYCVTYVGVCLSPVACILEYCEHGSLHQVLHNADKDRTAAEKLTWVQRIKCARDAALGLQYLHAKGMVHRYFTVRCLRMTNSLSVKVGALSYSAQSDATTAPSHVVPDSYFRTFSCRWMAPEVALALTKDEPPHQIFSQASDVYSFGLVLYELMTWRRPFANLSDAQILDSMSQGDLPPDLIPELWVRGGNFTGMDEYCSLMTDCRAVNPEERPNITEVARRLKKVLKMLQLSLQASNDGAGVSSPAAVNEAQTSEGSMQQEPVGPAATAEMEDSAGPMGLRPGKAPTRPSAAVDNINISPQGGDNGGSGNRSNGAVADAARSGMAPIDCFEVDFGELRLGHELGEGGFGTVYSARWRVHTLVAVKKLRTQTEDVMQSFRQEIAVHRQLRHPNIVQLLGVSTRTPYMFLMLPLCPQGSLRRQLSNWREQGPSAVPREHLRLRIARDVARGMHYLHSNRIPIVHKDLKSANILLEDNYTAKVCDFGLSRVRSATLLSNHSCVRGTPQWAAPEVLRGEPYGERSDVYSYGVVLWELITLRSPWEDERLNSYQIINEVGHNDIRLEIPADVIPEVKALLLDCWHREPSKRPDFHAVLDRLTAVRCFTCCGTSRI